MLPPGHRGRMSRMTLAGPALSPGTSTKRAGHVTLPSISSTGGLGHDDISHRAGAGYRARPGGRLLLDEDQLTEDELGLLYRVREFAETEVLPIINPYWERGSSVRAARHRRTGLRTHTRGHRRPHPAISADSRLAGQEGFKPGDRRAAVPRPRDRRLPPAEGIRQARRHLPRPARTRPSRAARHRRADRGTALSPARSGCIKETAAIQLTIH
jgi:hypothetical protein